MNGCQGSDQFWGIGMTSDRTLSGRLKFCGVVLAILTPFLLGCLLFEHLLGVIRKSAMEKAGEILPAAGRLLLEGRRPGMVLKDRFTREFGDNPILEVTASSVPGLMARVQRALGVPFRIFCYDNFGRLIFPQDDPERASRETLYAAIENYHIQKPFSPEVRRLDIEGRRLFRYFFGESDFMKAVSPHGFDWECIHPAIPPRFIFFAYCGRAKGSPNYGCLQIEVFTKDIPELHRDAHCLEFRSDGVPYAGIVVPSQRLLATESGSPWFSRERLLEPIGDDQVVSFDDGFFYSIPLPSETPRSLVLAIPVPFPLGIPAA